MIKNRTEVEVVFESDLSGLRVGDVGYIDGYCQGSNNIACAVVVSGNFISSIQLHCLRVIQ